MHLVLYRYCCEGRYSVNIHLKCLDKSGNLIMTGERPALLLCHGNSSTVVPVVVVVVVTE